MKKIKKLNGFIYDLERRDLKGTRSGILLRYEFEDDSIGVSDCHPWLERGDPSLKQVILLLKACNFSSQLLKRSYEIAIEDSKSTLRILEEKDKIKSHIITPLDEDFPLDFDVLKIKLGKDIENEIKIIKKKRRPHQKLRLDLNYKVTKKRFLSWMSKNLSWLSSYVEFIEDPFYEEENDWSICYKNYKIPLAWDYNEKGPQVLDSQFLVLKPALMSIDTMDFTKPFVITSYLAHPIEQVSSYYTACKVSKIHPKNTLFCGVISNFYKKNMFSEVLSTENQKLCFPKERHWGFEKILKGLKWKSIGSL